MKTLPQYQHDQLIDRAFLLEKLHSSDCVLLESARPDNDNKKNLLCIDPIEVLTAFELDEIPSLFEHIEEYLRQKKYIAGYFAYECGYHFENIVTDFKNTSSRPLIWLGVYNQPLEISAEVLSSVEPIKEITIPAMEFQISLDAYRANIEKIKEYIISGDTYQVNFTDRFEFVIKASAVDLYFSLRSRQHVPYSALIQTEYGTTLSFSPELFFRRDGNSITTKPMKGTCSRGRTLLEDAEHSHWLQNDEKNKSENLMIVDLLRNDTGRICEPGSVYVSDMYAVEKYETVLQMTSTVTGVLQRQKRYYDIFRSLFPCGSVTGAPKIRTMQIIKEMEKHQRGVYCGAIGYFSPDDTAVFNVGIRTITLYNGNGTMGAGSGIVIDSIPEQEFEECALKANFLLLSKPEFHLLETILWNGSYLFLEEHILRIRNSAEYFFIPFRKEIIIDMLQHERTKFHKKKQYRVRLLLSQQGTPTVESAEFDPVFSSSYISIAEEKINVNDPFYFHKTTNRTLYNKYYQNILPDTIADFIFLNEKNEITEGTFTNIFIKKDGRLFTPPITSGVLNGIFRSHMLASDPTASEKPLFLEDLFHADEIFICNSLRGIQKVTILNR